MTEDTSPLTVFERAVAAPLAIGKELQEIGARCRQMNAGRWAVKLSGTTLTEDLRGTFRLRNGVLELRLQLMPREEEDKKGGKTSAPVA